MKPALGVCYYPEHWPENQWDEDARCMAELGLTYVRVGEFSWSLLEPEPGQYDFNWLRRAIDTLDAHGLKTVLGTPTATPPKWLVDKMPDMVAIDENGQPRRFGARRHYCFSHPGYRCEAARITNALAEEFGAHPGIAAWQTDNEYGCHDTIISYSHAALAGFRIWLRDRYRTIDALNDAWGTRFWSMVYRDFEEIDLPDRTVTEAHPAHRLDFFRYSSDQVAAFDQQQVDIIRRASPGRMILHNFMGRFTDFDHFKVAEPHDAASWDSYPLGFLSERSAREPDHALAFARQGDPDFQAFHHDLYRAVGKGKWWVMEQQPGPVNWAPWNPAPLPGMVRLWSHEAIAHGAEVVCYFRWRQAPFGQEQMHTGLLRPDSSRDAGFVEAEQVRAEIEAVPETDPTLSPVALIFDYTSAWAWTIQPQGADFSYFELVFETYRTLRRAGLSVDILPPTADDWTSYSAVFAPGLFAWTDEMLTALAAFKGVALFGPRTGSRDQTFHIPKGLAPGLPRTLLDAKVTTTQSLNPGLTLTAGNAPGAFHRWFETLQTGPGVEVGYSTDDGPGLLRQNQVFYCAGWPDPTLYDRIIADVLDAASLSASPLPEGLRRRDHGALRYWFNYSTTRHDITDHGATGPFILDGPVLNAGGVAIERIKR